MDDVLLIYPYFYEPNRNAMLFHPLGIAQITAQLRQKNVGVRVLDCTFLTRDQVIAELKLSRAKITGIYVMLTMTESAVWLAQKAKQYNPETLLVCGGPLPTLWPGNFAESFDFVFKGEASGSFPKFCLDVMNLKSRKINLLEYSFQVSDYPGLYFKNKISGEAVYADNQSHDGSFLNTLPFPDRSDYNHKRYQQFWKHREGFGVASVMTTFGCPFSCHFCSKPVYGRNFRKRKADLILEEIKTIKTLGYEGFWIADDCFTLDMDHTRLFCNLLIEEKLEMKWICLSRTNFIKQSDIQLMQDAGCYKVFFGIESGDDDVLKLMNKKATVSDTRKTVELFSRTRIKTAGFFMIGYPGETPATVEKTCDFALSLPLDEISFTVPYPLPGTRLYEQTHPQNELIDWRHENENQLVFSSDLSEAYLKNKITETYDLFDANKSFLHSSMQNVVNSHAVQF
jgi:anaerobic magnesium-protoporphyrin IX monomethyl ester cyclase